MRFSGVTDKVVRGAAYNGALYEQANLAAKRLGLAGEEAKSFIANKLANATDEMKLDADLASRIITFTNDGRLSDSISQVIAVTANRFGKNDPAKADMVRAAARLIAPFRRTPANILSTSLRYAPVTGQLSAVSAYRDWTKALANASLNGSGASKQVAAAQRKLVERLTQQGTGLAFFALGSYLYSQGKLTGEMPQNPSEQEQWRLEGKQPESLLIGGQWIPIARVSPYGGMMTMAASVMHESQSGGVGKMLAEAPGTISRSVLNQPMVTGPKELLEAATNRTSTTDYSGNIVGSFVPTIVSQMARSEGKQRMPQNLLQQVTSKIPGLQDTAPERLNIFGEPVQKAKGIINVGVNPLPFTADQRSNDPLVREMSRIGANIGALGKNTGEAFERYQYRQREAGKFVRQDLEALVQSQEYQEADLEEKRHLMQSTVTKARNDLDRYLKETYNIEHD
jgi:hypothetical protein